MHFSVAINGNEDVYNLVWLQQPLIIPVPEVLMLRRMQDAGADLGWKNGSGWTALHYAALNGHVDVVQLLMARGCQATVDAATTRTRRRSTERHRKATLAHGGLMGVKLWWTCATAMRRRCTWLPNCHGRTAAALLEVWADASLQNSDGDTALDFAVVYRDPMTTQMSDIMLGYHNVNAIRQCTTGRPRDRGVHPSGGRGAAAVRGCAARGSDWRSRRPCCPLRGAGWASSRSICCAQCPVGEALVPLGLAPAPVASRAAEQEQQELAATEGSNIPSL
jgi:ankyrin repeat protein